MLRRPVPVLLCLILFPVLPAVYPGGSAARTVYVDPVQGDDLGDGAGPAAPVRTLARGVALCGPGDVLSLSAAGGTYSESLVFAGKGGTPVAPITVEGNGAVLSGLRAVPADDWRDDGTGVYLLPAGKGPKGAAMPFPTMGGERLPESTDPAALQPGSWRRTAEGILFRPPAGRHPRDLDIRVTALDCGVAISAASHLTVRNLTAEHFANDGFNVHGNCRNLTFENIRGRNNGDDGFSIHEDVSAVIRGGHFHGNTYGIQDINASQSIYHGILAEGNRAIGVDFLGGLRVLTDSVVRDNAGPQVRITSDRAATLGYPDGSPLTEGTAFLRDVAILGGPMGVRVEGRARATLTNCLVQGSGTGVSVGPAAFLQLGDSIVAHCRDRELSAEGAEPGLLSYRNVVFPGRVRLGAEEGGEGLVNSVRGGAPSIVAEPVFGTPGGFVADAFATRGGMPGPPVGLTAEPAPAGAVLPLVNPFARKGSAAGEARFAYDFEAFSPWSRVYPVPEENAAGVPVTFEAALSEENPRSGAKSLKLGVTFPAGPPGAWTVKLFSLRLPVARPVAGFDVHVFIPGPSSVRFRPRVRDAGGEAFYGPEQRSIPGEWQAIRWDLHRNPPTNPRRPGDDGVQDVPPVELVIEFYPEPGPEGGTFTAYLDDAEIRLEPGRGR